MVHVIFDINSVNLEDFIPQVGSGELSYFRGIPPYQRGFGRRQRGGGVGDLLRNLWRILRPVIRSTGTALGKEALATGGRILDRIETGGDGGTFKPELITEIKKGVDNVLEKGGIGRQFGTGTIMNSIKGTRKRKFNTKNIIGRTVVPKRKIKKKKRSDVFGLF